MHSRLLGVAVILFLLLAGAFISYQFNRENRLHMIALQNELQGLMNKGQQARPCVWLGATYQPLLWKGAILVGAWISM